MRGVRSVLWLSVVSVLGPMASLSAQQHDLPISGSPMSPLRAPARFDTTSAARAAFAPSVAGAPELVSCAKVARVSRSVAASVPTYTMHDVRGGPGRVGQSDIALYVDSLNRLTYAIELRASQPFFRAPSGLATPGDSVIASYTNHTNFTVIELDPVANRARSFNVVKGAYQPGVAGTVASVDAIASLGSPLARATSALAMCQQQHAK